MNTSIIPGLTDDAARLCLGRAPRSSLRFLVGVCRRWRSVIGSEDFAAVRRTAGVHENFLCVLMESECGREVYWEVFDGSGTKIGNIPPVPGPVKRGFGVAVVAGKILFMGGYTEVEGQGINTTNLSASSQVYEYDPRVNRWTKLPDMNTPRYNSACAELNGRVYCIRGYARHAFSLSSAEIYDPITTTWTLMECPSRPVWRGFAFAFKGRLYAVGNGSRFIDVYDPKSQTWLETNTQERQCHSVYSYVVLGNKIYFMDRANPGKVGVYEPETGSWSSVSIPLGRCLSSGLWFRLGLWDEMLALFSQQCGDDVLVYEAGASSGLEWKLCSQMNLSGSHLCSVMVSV